MQKCKYQVIYDALYNRLQQGQYPVGIRLPPESALVQEFNVNRLTLRRALDMLCQNGYLSVRQGSGYIVNTISPPQINCLHSFTDIVLKQGHTPGAKLLDVQVPYTGDSTTYENIFDTPVCLIRRLRTIDEMPWFLAETYVPMALVQGVTYADFSETGREQSILNILRNRFSLSWVKACETIQPQIANCQVAEWLDIAPNTSLLAQRCVAYDENNQPVFCDDTLRAKPITYDLVGTERILNGF